MAEENKALMRRLFQEVWNKGNLDIVNELVDMHCVLHDPANPDLEPGLESFKRYVTMYRSAFPNLEAVIEDLEAIGDKVVTRWTARGTHVGELGDIAPTGRRMTITGIYIDRIANGKIEEHWVNWDTMGAMQQLGVVSQLRVLKT